MTYAPGAGTLLKMKIATVYTTVAQITKLTPPSSEMGTVETTIISDSAKTFLATIRDSGEVTFTVEWDSADATHAALWTAHRAGTLTDFEVLFADVGATTVEFHAIVTKFPWDEISNEIVVTIPITLKLSGDITITP